MNRNIGFFGGGSVMQLGSINDVKVFFKCIDEYIAKTHPSTDWSLFTDKLYRRYINQKELPTFIKQVKEAKKIFLNIPTYKVDFKKLGINANNTQLKLQESDLLAVFDKYFKSLEHCIEMVMLIIDKRHNYNQPIRTVVSDLPEFYADDDRPLEEYDNLEGEPFWLRTEPTIEAFNVEETIDSEGGIIKTSWIRKKEK